MTLAGSLGSPWFSPCASALPQCTHRVDRPLRVPLGTPWVANEAIPSPSRRLADQNGGAGGQNLPKVYML